MATVLSFLSGRQITNSNGVPQAGALLYHYQAGTTTNLTVYSNQAGTVAHAQPVVCDAGGFVPLIYVGDTSDWKVIVQTAGAVVLQTYDNLPSAVAEVSSSDFAPPLLPWVQVTSTPQTLTAANAGNAYEANTTSNSIEFDLPSAASVGNGKGFWFKKTSASNSMIIDPSGSETIDDVSTSLTITAKDTLIGIFSNGAEWYTVVGYGLFRIIDNLTEDTLPDRAADFLVTYDASAGLEKKVKPNSLIVPGTLIAIIEDQKTQNTAAQSLTSGADRTRDLNTLSFNKNTLVSLATNQFTLPIGTWEIQWQTGIGSVATTLHQSLLRNVTDNTDVARGTSGRGDDGASVDVGQYTTTGATVVTIAASKAFELRHRVSATVNGGDPANHGTEIYSRVIVRAA